MKTSPTYLEVVQQEIDLTSVHEGVSTARLQLQSCLEIRETEDRVIDRVLTSLDEQRAALHQGVHLYLLLGLWGFLNDGVEQDKGLLQLFGQDQKGCLQQLGLESVGATGGDLLVTERDDLLELFVVVTLLGLAVRAVPG